MATTAEAGSASSPADLCGNPERRRWLPRTGDMSWSPSLESAGHAWLTVQRSCVHHVCRVPACAGRITVTERKRRDRSDWLPEPWRGGGGDMRRVGREGTGLPRVPARPGVDRRAGSSGASGHFCPGGLGFPVTGSLPVGLSLANRAPVGWEGNSARGRAVLRPLRAADNARAGRPQARLRDVGARGLPDVITAQAVHWRPGRRIRLQDDLCMAGISLPGRRGCQRRGGIAAVPRG